MKMNEAMWFYHVLPASMGIEPKLTSRKLHFTKKSWQFHLQKCAVGGMKKRIVNKNVNVKKNAQIRQQNVWSMSDLAKPLHDFTTKEVFKLRNSLEILAWFYLDWGLYSSSQFGDLGISQPEELWSARTLAAS